jgi:hypothetical protein
MDILQTDNKPTLKPKIAKEYVFANITNRTVKSTKTQSKG